MNIWKAFLAAILFIVGIELIGIWVLLDTIWDLSILTRKYYKLINGTLELVIIYLVLRKLEGPKFWQPIHARPWYFFAAAVLGFVFVFLQMPLNGFYNQFSQEQYEVALYLNLNRPFTPNVVAAVLFFPIAEELFFRRYLQYNLRMTYKPSVAIFLSAALFAFVHLPFTELIFTNPMFSFHHAYITLFGGLISAWLYQKSGSILTPILFHIFWNLTGSLV